MMSGRYIGKAGAADNRRQENTSRGSGGNVQPSAEEIAALLANSYLVHSAADGEKDSESERSIRRQQRLKEMKRRKRQQELMRKFMLPCAVIVIVCVVFAGLGIRKLVRRQQRPQDVKQSGTMDGSASDRGNSDSVKTGQSSSAQTDLSQGSSDQGDLSQGDPVKADLDQDNAARTGSSKKISYDSSLNVAGVYIDNTIADRINDEMVQIGTGFVRTLGGNSKEPPLRAVADEATTLPDSGVVSTNSVFIDVGAGRILGQMDAGARISPASMTKILTLLVAAEHITDADDMFEITQDITDYSYVHDCSNAGFEVGERVTVRDLFYGTALPSGADAALGLAEYVAGSQEAFVGLMNEKLDALGLSGTSHFTNCVGLYDGNHYSTVYDMAVMLKAACDNSFCRKVLSARTYTTSATEQHPEGMILSNWFLRRIEDKDTHGEVLCAKTGFVKQSGNCAASMGIDQSGKEYICVTANANSSWRCIYDHVALYQQFLPG